MTFTVKVEQDVSLYEDVEYRVDITDTETEKRYYATGQTAGDAFQEALNDLVFDKASQVTP